MKLNKVLLGQAIRLATRTGEPKEPFQGGNVYRAFEARYGFLQGPKALAEFDASKGITFLQGQFEGFVIDKCQIFNNGILVNAQATTENADQFINNALRWIRDELGVTIDEKGRAYLSEIEVHCDYALEKSLARFEDFGRKLGAFARSYGQNSTDFGLSGLHFSANVATLPAPKPVAFRFDRRAEQPWDSGLYFASAPIRTDDHLRLLEEFEALIKSL